MFRKRKSEWLPWYRQKDYKGDLTEAEKRQLDAFRASGEHPSANPGSLPEEVKGYISNIESEKYDRKSDSRFHNTVMITVAGLQMIYIFYLRHDEYRVFGYIIIPILIALFWWQNHLESVRDLDDYLPPPGSDKPFPTDEGIRREWELRYIFESRQAARRGEARP